MTRDVRFRRAQENGAASRRDSGLDVKALDEQFWSELEVQNSGICRILVVVVREADVGSRAN